MNDITTPLQQQIEMPTALALYFDPRIFEVAKSVAEMMAKAEGITPKHLLGKKEACFAVCTRAFGWKLDPFWVGRGTFQTPGGQIGFEGKIIHAIIEQSGHLEPGTNGVRFHHYGDWSHVQGKFVERESKREDEHGNKVKYKVPAWTDEDAKKGGCGVVVRARLRGEDVDRELRFDLIQAQPRNSTLWATDPMTQIKYAAVRRFASSVVPGVLMGVPLDDEAPAREVYMGEAVREPIEMPRPKQQPTAELIDQETGEVTQHHEADNNDTTKEQTDRGKEAEPASPPLGDRTPTQNAPPSFITKGAADMLRRQLSDFKLTEAFNKQFGVADPSEVPMSKLNDAMTWMGANKAK
jgi:hypothetical protein